MDHTARGRRASAADAAALGSTDVVFVHQPAPKAGVARDLIASIRRVLDEATSAPMVRLPRTRGYPY